jgi:hypothetical protein
VQAKRLSDNRRYLELDHRVGESEVLQIDLLIESSFRDARRWGVPVIPLYCFYNGWVDEPSLSPNTEDADWPVSVNCMVCPKGRTPPDCIHASLRMHGCTVASAYMVQLLMESEGRPYSLERYLGLSVPWSKLFVASEELLLAYPGMAPKAKDPFKATRVAAGVLRQTQWLWQEALEWLPDSSPDDLEPWSVLGDFPMNAPGPRPAAYVSRLINEDLDGLNFAKEQPGVKAVAVLEVPSTPSD